jgi:hypothetical protein
MTQNMCLNGADRKDDRADALLLTPMHFFYEDNMATPLFISNVKNKRGRQPCHHLEEENSVVLNHNRHTYHRQSNA